MPDEEPSSRTVGQIGEDPLVADVISRYPGADWLTVGPGDDAAVLDLTTRPGPLVVSTDTLVEGQDFRRDWSSARDVGVKTAAQNFADIAAMGGRPHTLLVSLTAPADLPAAWARGLADGLAAECARAGAVVAGGDLSSGTELSITGTALGTLTAAAPVLRSGARPGDVVAVAGVSGRSAAGWALLLAGHGLLTDAESPADVRVPADAGSSAEVPVPAGAGLSADAGLIADAGLLAALARLVDDHRRPRPPYSAGPEAALAGATAMIDISDGLVRDAERVARASGVVLDLDPQALQPDADLLAAAKFLGALGELGQPGEPAESGEPGEPGEPGELSRPGDSRGEPDPLEWVLSGGEDHALLACFRPETALPPSFRRIGSVISRTTSTDTADTATEADAAVLLAGARIKGPGGWRHFA